MSISVKFVCCPCGLCVLSLCVCVSGLLSSLKSLVSEWLRAPIVLHDIWSVDMTLREGGQFKQIDSKTRVKKTIVDGRGNPSRKLCKKMNNYFSIGIESRIGIGFDRHRKATAFQNKVVRPPPHLHTPPHTPPTHTPLHTSDYYASSPTPFYLISISIDLGAHVMCS